MLPNPPPRAPKRSRNPPSKKSGIDVLHGFFWRRSLPRARAPLAFYSVRSNIRFPNESAALFSRTRTSGWRLVSQAIYVHDVPKGIFLLKDHYLRCD